MARGTDGDLAQSRYTDVRERINLNQPEPPHGYTADSVNRVAADRGTGILIARTDELTRQNVLIWMAPFVIRPESSAVHIGGSARGYLADLSLRLRSGIVGHNGTIASVPEISMQARRTQGTYSSAAIRAGVHCREWQEQPGSGTACHGRQVVAPELAGSLDRMQNSLPSGSASVIQPLPSGRR